MQDFLYELGYHHDEDLDCVADNIISLKQKDNNINIIRLQDSDIDSLTKDSPLYLLRALYTCKPFAICNENNESFITKENVSKILGYKSDFANIFVYGKVSLSDTYLQARKALYKTMINLREEREQKHKEEQERISQLSYKEYKEEQKEKERQERQERFSNKNTANKDLHLILESNDKDTKIIFLDSLKDSQSHIHTFSNSQANANTSTNFQDSNNSYLANTSLSFANLIFQHNNKVSIFARDNSVIDSKQQVPSTCTKNFVNRYELVHHILNTLSGYSSTIFYDECNTEYIIALRGTESIREIA